MHDLSILDWRSIWSTKLAKAGFTSVTEAADSSSTFVHCSQGLVFDARLAMLRGHWKSQYFSRDVTRLLCHLNKSKPMAFTSTLKHPLLMKMFVLGETIPVTRDATSMVIWVHCLMHGMETFSNNSIFSTSNNASMNWIQRDESDTLRIIYHQGTFLCVSSLSPSELVESSSSSASLISNRSDISAVSLRMTLLSFMSF